MKLIFKILITFLLVSTIWLLFSCGSRKVSTEKQKEETKTEFKDNSVTEKQSESNIKSDTAVKVDDKNETVTEEISYTPADPAKESFIIEKDGTKTVLNNVKKTVKKTIHKNNTQTQKSGNSELVQKEAVKEQKTVERKEVSKKEIKSKQTERTAISWYWYLFLLIPIGIVYWYLKRCRIF